MTPPFGCLGDVIDHAAGAAQALDGRSTVDYFDALDQQRVDRGGRHAPDVPQWGGYQHPVQEELGSFAPQQLTRRCQIVK